MEPVKQGAQKCSILPPIEFHGDDTLALTIAQQKNYCDSTVLGFL